MAWNFNVCEEIPTYWFDETQHIRIPTSTKAFTNFKGSYGWSKKGGRANYECFFGVVFLHLLQQHIWFYSCIAGLSFHLHTCVQIKICMCLYWGDICLNWKSWKPFFLIPITSNLIYERMWPSLQCLWRHLHNSKNTLSCSVVICRCFIIGSFVDL